jgi:4-hydroxyacetophenone monooxygenase
VERALAQANVNALRLALYQLTGDPELEAMKIVEQPVWGGTFLLPTLASEDQERVRSKAVAFLAEPAPPSPALPDDAERDRLMVMFTGRDLSPQQLRFGGEELAFDEHPRAVNWTERPPEAQVDKYKAVIVGAGISGIAAAVLLAQLGIPFVMIEKEAGVGGTWWINNYPECRVDIGAHLYQYKFEKNYPWTEYFPSRHETLRYLEHIVGKFGLRPHLKLSTRVTAADWDDNAGVWRVQYEDSDGRSDTINANFVLNASGQFGKPNIPDIPGIKDFEGAIFHSTQWDQSIDLAGKRVGLIGNGATGSQLMPHLARVSKHLKVFQRSPQWVIAIENYRSQIAPEQLWLFDNMPFYWNWFCYSAFVQTYEFQYLTVFDREWMANGGLISKRNDQLRRVLLEYIDKKVGEKPALAKALTPSYAPLGRRIIADNGWFDALMRDNVDLVTGGIERFTADGVVTRDGVKHPLDVMVLSAGFKVSDYTWPINYATRGGLTLRDAWKVDGPRAYFSMMVPEFPNFFMFYGPNAQARAGGFYSWAEIWARYVVKLIVHLIESGRKSVEVTAAAHDDYNRRLDEAAKDNIRGPESAGSYYVNEHGRAGINMPWLAEDWHAMLINPDFNDLKVQ